MTTKEDFTKQLDADGPETVRHKLTRGLYSGARAAWASEWLGAKDDASQSQQSALAQGALAQAKRANVIATVSAVIATIAAVIALFKGG